ncbi:DUF6011 domain-containing protein [Streptomyces sp. NPDC059255]|uniref:DUF6011 domain-containing protein n=1 Tax=Streptomyces sp. NPDC059255 TaxID=3346793 RepID=UPI0036CDDA6B
MTGLPDGYYAVLDPADPQTMTYWRARAGELKAWPAGAWHGPARLLKKDAPADRDERVAWMRDWQARYRAWLETLHAALAADPAGARRTFVGFTVRCCLCGRALRDEKSKVLGVGPECRTGLDEHALAALLTPAIATAHATHTHAQLPTEDEA